MADYTGDSMCSTSNSASGKADSKVDLDVNNLFDKYLDEVTSQPKYAERKKGNYVSKETEDFRKNWEKEIEKIPAFMNKVPDDPEGNALVEALQAIKYDEDDPPDEQAKVHKDDGNEWFKKRKYKLAITAYSEGLKLNFDDNDLRAILHTNRAAASFHIGNFRSSVNDAKEAVKYKPSHLKALVRGAECCIKLEEYDEAIAWCDSALKVAADDKRVLEMRLMASKQKKLLERNKRKRKVEEKAADARKMKVVEAIKSRQIQFGQLREEVKDEARSQDSLILEAVTTQHPSGGCITLDESGRLIWPVTFLYPEHSQSDFIVAFHEDSILLDHLEAMFEEVPPWDSQRAYRPDTVQVYFHHAEGTELVEVGHGTPLGAILQDPRYLVASEPLFVILPRGTPFTKSYLQRYTNLL